MATPVRRAEAALIGRVLHPPARMVVCPECDCGDDYCIRSRRGWNMTELLPELRPVPAGLYDGELVVFREGEPTFPDVCSRVLNGDRSIPLVDILFAMLAHRPTAAARPRASAPGNSSFGQRRLS